MVRYVDDFVCLFQYENEAQKFYQFLIERPKKLKMKREAIKKLIWGIYTKGLWTPLKR